MLLESGAANPLVPAAPVSDTVQLVVVGVASVVLVQVNELSETGVGSVIVPDPPPAGIGVPEAVDANTLVKPTPMVVVDGFAAI